MYSDRLSGRSSASDHRWPRAGDPSLCYGGSGSAVGDSCYASKNISAVGLGSRLLFFASTTRNSISLRSLLANDSAIKRATSWWCSPEMPFSKINSHPVLHYSHMCAILLWRNTKVPMEKKSLMYFHYRKPSYGRASFDRGKANKPVRTENPLIQNDSQLFKLCLGIALNSSNSFLYSASCMCCTWRLKKSLKFTKSRFFERV